MGFPARLRRGAGGETAYFDGANEPVVLPAGSGIGTVLGTVDVAVQVLTPVEYDGLTAFFTGVAAARREAIAQRVAELVA